MDNKVDFTRFKDVVKLVDCKNRMENTSIMSGFERLDEVKQGWFLGELCVIGGRPSIGKTGFIMSFISNLLNRNIPVSLFSATDKLNQHFVARFLKFLEDDEYMYNKEELNKTDIIDFSKIPFYLNFQHEMTLDYIKDNAQILVHDYGVKCIFIEDLQSIFYSEINGNTREGMEIVCSDLKKLARDLNVPIIVTSDLNRSVEHCEWSKEPLMSHLCGSSAIENMADSVILLHRPEYYKIYQDLRGNDLRNIIEIQIHKNQNRCIGNAIYRFNHSIGCVEDFKSLIPIPKTEMLKIKDIHL